MARTINDPDARATLEEMMGTKSLTKLNDILLRCRHGMLRNEDEATQMDWACIYMDTSAKLDGLR